MSDSSNSSPRKPDILKNFTGRAATLQDADQQSPSSSPSLRKKNTFFGSIRATMKKHKSIEIIKSQEFIQEEQDQGHFMVSKFQIKKKFNIYGTNVLA